MKDIYEKNMAVLKERYEDLYQKIREWERVFDESDRIVVDQSVKGEDIFAIKQGEDLVYLNSRYDDDTLTEKWVEQYKRNNAYNVYIIFGISNGRHIQKLLEYITDTNAMLVYEPDPEIFYKNLQIHDIRAMLQKPELILCVRGGNDGYLTEFILFALKYATINRTKYCCMQNYGLLYLHEWLEIVKSIKGRFSSIIMSRNTEIFFSEEFIVNFIANCRDFVRQYSLNQLRKAVEENRLNEVPAIIVSAGPSLDRNIEELKKARNKAMIIGVDTSLKSLLNHDIIPDVVVTVDSHKPPILFMHTKFKNIPLVVCSQSNKELFHICDGKRFYFDEESSYMSGLYKSIKGERLQPTESGGSVANNAFSLANVLGFKNIIFVGQDLAYTGKKMHTNAAYGQTEEDMVRDNGKKYFEVEDIYGEKVLTEENMDLYRKWFEEQIVRYSELDVIDATEGGAKIKGTKIMTLREAIAQYCKKTVNVGEVIRQIKPQFTEEEQRQLYEKIDHIPVELKEIEKKLKEGIRNYERLDKLGRKDKTHTKEYRTLVQKVGELSEYVEKAPELDMVSLYNRQTEYGVLGQVLEVKENKQDEIKDITKNGIRMLQSYIDGMDSLNKDLERMKTVEREVFDQNRSDLQKSIAGLQEVCFQKEYDKIDTAMKDFYQYLLREVDSVDILNKNENFDRNQQEFYDELLHILAEIVNMLEKRDYDGFTELLAQLNEELDKIGAFYYEL